MRQEIWVTHETVYDFDREVDGVELRARLRPVDDDAQTVLESEVLCHPRPAKRSLTRDASGPVDRLMLRGPLRRIEVRGQSRLRWTPGAAAPSRSPPLGARPELVPSWARPGGPIWTWAAETLPDSLPSRADVAAFLERFRGTFAFDPAATTQTISVPTFFAAGRGVCQDYARLAVGCLRARGVSAQIVLGYLVREPGGEPRFEEGQPHAWISIWDPEAGWTDADPTTGYLPPTHHVTLRRGLELRDVQPVTGRILASGRAQQRLTVRVTIVKEDVTP